MISFIICTYNRDKYIYECLSRLAQNSCLSGWEIVLVNNNSTDHTESECMRFRFQYPQVDYHYFVETRQGLSFARNHGIMESKGDWLVFLDDDALVESDYIANMQHHLAADGDLSSDNIGAFGGKIVPLFEEGAPSWYSRWTMSYVSAIDLGGNVCRFKGRQYPIGANMGVKREVINRVGVFNTDLGRSGNNLLGGEEKDLFNRIKTAGYGIAYFPDITVRHCIPPRRTTEEFIARMGYGVGVSERRRTLKTGIYTYLTRILSECVKWCATIVLWLYYSLVCQSAKGKILLMFRYQVTKGLLCGA